MSTSVALVRRVGSSFRDCLAATPPVPPLDPGLASKQHAAYVACLEEHGFAVTVVDADERHPDGCFIEDTAVVIGETALVTHPGHQSRRGEVEAVAAALESLVGIERMAAPATLDGGDVLQIGGQIFVGVGSRTNQQGFEVLADFARRMGKAITSVRPEGVLHLKSAATALDDDTVLLHGGFVDPGAFEGFRVIQVEGTDPEAANVVRLGDGSILIGHGYDSTASLVAGLGYRVVRVDVSEFARADGGLTCLSIRIRGTSR